MQFRSLLLLMFAFVNEVIDTIRLEALKDRLHLLVEKRFRGELNRLCCASGRTSTSPANAPTD